MLAGKLLAKHLPVLVLDVAGVGYEVEASIPTFVSLPEPGKQVMLHIHLVTRENAQLLYGFADQEDRDMFRLLIGVTGVGPKLALAILSGMTASEFRHCVAGQEVSALTRLPGVGNKTAARLLVEMRDRLPVLSADEEAPKVQGVSQASKTEAKDALRALGYSPQRAARAVDAVWADDMTIEQVIMAALKSMLT